MTPETHSNHNEDSNTKPFEEVPPLDENDQRLVSEYLRAGIPTDRLVYSDAFNDLVERLKRGGDNRDKQELWQRLVNLRKAGRLPRLAG